MKLCVKSKFFFNVDGLVKMILMKLMVMMMEIMMVLMLLVWQYYKSN